jgi:hypothetical protein
MSSIVKFLHHKSTTDVDNLQIKSMNYTNCEYFYVLILQYLFFFRLKINIARP